MTATGVTEQVRIWIREQIEGQDEIRLPDLADAAVANFSLEPEFVHAFLALHLRPTVYELAQKVMAQTRGADKILLLGDNLVTRDGLTDRAKKLQNKWARWLEHVDDRHMRLLDMEAAHLRQAAAERRKRAETEIEIALLFETLANRLKPGQSVGDLFSPDEIERVRESLQQREAA